jgi:hypothetical protein
MTGAMDGPTLLVLCLGLGLVAAGVAGVLKGRTWINSAGGWSIRTVVRSENPTSFWCITILLYWGLGTLLILCAALFALQNLGYVSRPPF